MKIKSAHITTASLFAIALHFSLALAYSIYSSPSAIAMSGAQQAGEDGLIAGLGLAGSFVDTSAAASSEEAPNEQVQEELVDIKEAQTPDEVAEIEPALEAIEETIEEPTPVETIDMEKKQTDLPAELPAPEQVAKKLETTQPETKQAETKQAEDSKTQEDIFDSKQNSRATIKATGTGKSTTTGGKPAIQQTYLSRILAHAARHKRYPRSARRAGVTGTVHVIFYLKTNGRLKRPRITKSSGDPRLDQEALDMLLRATPFPAIPEELSKDGLDLTLPIEFSLNSSNTLF